MKTAKLKDMVKGWVVGNFKPTLYTTTHVEFAVKKYKSGDKEAKHYHKIATEITVVTKGKVKMNGVTYREGDIIVLDPLEVTDFIAVTAAVTAVVKIPGINNDKYIAGK